VNIEEIGREELAIDSLLEELAELRELDRRRQEYPPGSPRWAEATSEIDERSRLLLEHFRTFTGEPLPERASVSRPRGDRATIG